MNSALLIPAAEKALSLIFNGIDGQVKGNIRRILEIYRRHRVGVRHFASVSGYGHDDLGRETMDKVFADIVGAEAAAVRVQFVSGTHAIACALFGVLRPGDEMLSVAGAPYDTLEEVIGTRGTGQGSLKEFGIAYRELALLSDGGIDWDTLSHSIQNHTRLVLIQRSCGYAWRSSLSIADIDRIVEIVKTAKSTYCLFCR